MADPIVILPEWMVVSVSVLNWLLSLFLGLIQPSAHTIQVMTDRNWEQATWNVGN
jgi:hypothetical protein